MEILKVYKAVFSAKLMPLLAARKGVASTKGSTIFRSRSRISDGEGYRDAHSSVLLSPLSGAKRIKKGTEDVGRDIPDVWDEIRTDLSRGPIFPGFLFSWTGTSNICKMNIQIQQSPLWKIANSIKGAKSPNQGILGTPTRDL